MYVCVREFRTFLFHMEMSATRNALHSNASVCVCKCENFCVRSYALLGIESNQCLP